MEFTENEDGSGMGKVVIGGPADMANAVYQIVYRGIERVRDGDGMSCCELAGAAGMGATLNLALVICKKPDHLPVGKIHKKDSAPIFASLKTEHLIFASLMVAHQFDLIREHDADHMALKANFGPSIFGLALAQWQKLYPHLNAEDYFEGPVVDMARKELPSMEQDFDVQKIPTGSFIMRNNGSIN